MLIYFSQVLKNKIKLLTKEKIDNICEEEITSINCSENNIIIGSKEITIV